MVEFDDERVVELSLSSFGTAMAGVLVCLSLSFFFSHCDDDDVADMKVKEV